MSNDSNFDSLFTPFSIGKMEIKNRLVMSPMGTYAALMDGSVSDTLATYFEERAKGGVGAIITASQYLTPKLAQVRASAVSSVPVTAPPVATGASLTATTLTVVVATLE